MAGARSPEALLRRVELRVARRLDGILQGERRGRRPGPGDEPALTRAYEPGDDVRWVDWPLTAREGRPMVRVPELEPVLTAWALVDLSPSMRFGTAVRTKLELAQEVLAGVGAVLRRRGDRLGVAATVGGDLDLVRPPRGDRRALIAAIAAVQRAAAVDPGDEADGRTLLGRAVTGLGRIARHRGLVAILSDFPRDDALESALGVLARRHEVIAIELRDPRERLLPPSGPLTLRDMETGRALLVDTADPRFRAAFAAAADRDEEERAAMLARVGARRVVLRTDRDWVLPLARALARPGTTRRVA
ncbi:MAG: DUF58 domain-containing protein [Actinomycetota bacterium]